MDFPTFFEGDNPVGWTRQCEKYLDLALVPQGMWVSMAPLHCCGRAFSSKHAVVPRWDRNKSSSRHMNGKGFLHGIRH